MKWNYKQVGVLFTLKLDVYVLKSHVFFVINVKVWDVHLHG